MPTFGVFGLGRQLSRDSTDIETWALKEIFNTALKKGKGQQEILTGAIFKGSRDHTALKAGGTESAQYLVAQKGVVTTSEKYLVVHSAHTTIKFVAGAWNALGTYPETGSAHRSPSRAEDSRQDPTYVIYDPFQPEYSSS